MKFKVGKYALKLVLEIFKYPIQLSLIKTRTFFNKQKQTCAQKNFNSKTMYPEQEILKENS